MEIIPVVDKKNNVIGLENRKTVHEKGMFHRGVYVIISNSSGEFLLQQRSAHKSICPLFWDLSLAERLKPKETYVKAAKRGLEEELRIAKVKLTKLREAHIQKMIIGSVKDYQFVELYKTVFDGKPKTNPKEVAEAGFFTIEEIEKLESEKKLTPWFLDEWNWISRNFSSKHRKYKKVNS